MRYLLDTTALLAHYRQELGWEAVQALLEDTAAEITLASPSIAEFSRRMHDLGADDRAVSYTHLDVYKRQGCALRAPWLLINPVPAQ